MSAALTKIADLEAERDALQEALDKALDRIEHLEALIGDAEPDDDVEADAVDMLGEDEDKEFADFMASVPASPPEPDA